MSKWPRSNLLISLVYFFGNFALSIVYPVFGKLFLQPYFASSLLTTDRTTRLFFFSLIVAAFSLAQTCGLRYIDNWLFHIGYRWAFTISILFISLGLAISAIAFYFDSYVILLIGRLISGFFSAAAPLCVTCMVKVDQEHQRLQTFPSFFYALYGASFILGVVFGGALSDTHINRYLDPSLSFWLATGVGLIIALIFFCATRRSPFEVLPACRHITLKDLSYIAKHFTCQRRFIAYFLFVMSWMVSLQFVSIFMVSIYGVQKMIFTLLLFSMGILWVLGILLFNHLPKSKNHICSLLFTASLVSFGIRTFLHLEITCIAFASFSFLVGLAWGYMMNLLSFPEEPLDKQLYLVGYKQITASLATLIAPMGVGLFSIINVRVVYFASSLCLFIAFLILLFKKQSRLPFS